MKIVSGMFLVSVSQIEIESIGVTVAFTMVILKCISECYSN